MKGIENNFKWALQALAVSAEEQVASSAPFADLPFEVLDDFDTWSESYQREFKNSLSAELSREIDELRVLTQSCEYDELLDSNLLAMKQPIWGPLRLKAKSILERLSWPVEPPPLSVTGWWIFKTWSRP